MEVTKKTWYYKPRTLFFISLAVFSLIYTIQAVTNHYLLRTYALDYGYYNQAFWDFAHLRANYNTVMEPPLNFFQIHSGFTLMLISPLYWIFVPIFGTYSLLIIQNIFIVLGGYSVYLLIRRKTNNEWIAFLAFLHYNLIWGHYSAIAFDFTETTVGASLVPLFLLLFDRRKYMLSIAVFLLIITCKENMPIWFIFIAILLFLIYRKSEAKWWALGFGLFSIIYLFFVFKVVIPYFEDPSLPYWGFAYSALGGNIGEAFSFVISNPFEALRMLFVNHLNDPTLKGIKGEFYAVFLLSGGLLLFRRPIYLLPFIPVIAQKMFNDGFIRWGISTFYSIEVVSILTVFIFLASDTVKHVKVKYFIYLTLCISTFLVTATKMHQRKSLWYDRNKEKIYSCDFYRSNQEVRKIRKTIREYLPKDSSFVASQSIVPHFSFRENARIFPYVHNARYMILLKESNTYPLTPQDFEREMRKYMNDPEWETLLDDHPLLILRKR